MGSDYESINLCLQRTDSLVSITYDAMHIIDAYGDASKDIEAIVDIAMKSIRKMMIDKLNRLERK